VTESLVPTQAKSSQYRSIESNGFCIPNLLDCREAPGPEAYVDSLPSCLIFDFLSLRSIAY